MATTTKKSTRSKTKTSKAKTTTKSTAVKKTTAAAKTTARKNTKTVSAKAKNSKSTTKPKAAKNLVGSNRSVVSVINQKVTAQTLRSLNMVTAGLLALLALAAAYLMNALSYPLTVGYMARDVLQSADQTVFAPAVQTVMDVEIRWLVVATLLLSLVLPILYMTKLKEKYEAYLNKTRMVPFRWVDLAVTGSLMVATVALLSGVNSLPTLKLLGGLMVITAALGLIAERQNDKAVVPVKSAYYLSLFAGVLPILLFASYAIYTTVYGMVRYPWYVYALYAVILIGFGLIARNLRMQIRGANYMIVERNYLAFNLLTKAAFAVVLIIGLASI